jgi:hypothetical protein
MFDHRWMFDHDAFDHGMMFDHLSRPQDSTDGTTLADVLPRMLVTSFISAVQLCLRRRVPHTCAQTPASPSPHPPHIHPPTIAAHGPCPRPLAPPGLGGGGAAAGPEECTRARGRFSCRVGEAGRAQGVGRGGGKGGASWHLCDGGLEEESEPLILSARQVGHEVAGHLVHR